MAHKSVLDSFLESGVGLAVKIRDHEKIVEQLPPILREKYMGSVTTVRDIICGSNTRAENDRVEPEWVIG